MENIEQMLQGVLSDPRMMEQIMGLARSLDPGQNTEPESQQETAPLPDPGPLLSLLKQSGIDRSQQNLLTALSPYLSDRRMGKLRKAMQAAAVARTATSLLGQGQSGRV